MKTLKRSNSLEISGIIRDAAKIPTLKTATLTRKQFADWIRKTPGAIILGLTTCTDCRARKNPFGKIFKLATGAAITGANYAAAVNREAARQGVKNPKFEAAPLVWGEWDTPSKLIKHGDNIYLRVESAPNQRRKAPVKVLGYQDEKGNGLSKEIIEQYISKPKESSRQQRAGLTETVWVRTIDLSSIKKVRIMGKTYKLSD